MNRLLHNNMCHAVGNYLYKVRHMNSPATITPGNLEYDVCGVELLNNWD